MSTGSSRSPPARAGCACSPASRSARGSSRRSSRAGRSISLYRAETELDFQPSTFQQAAGLVAYYNRQKFHFLAVTWDERQGRVLTILSCEGDYPEGRLSFPLGSPIPLDADGPVRLAVSVDHANLQFAYASGGEGEWRNAGPRSTPRSCRMKPEAGSIARSPAPSSAWLHSMSREARSTPTSGISSTRNA